MKVASLKEEGWTFDCDREETAEREFGAILALSGWWMMERIRRSGERRKRYRGGPQAWRLVGCLEICCLKR